MTQPRCHPMPFDWIAVDWGTTHLRAWAMAHDGAVIAQAASKDGMATLTQDGFEPALLRLIDPWLGTGPVRVIACGAVGSRQGWAEAPYAKTPHAPGTAELVAVSCTDPRLSVSIVPGVAQDQPADVMRGEETQINGFIIQNPDWDGVLCLPGTHTKWVQLSAREIVSFRTAMTGELFALLSQHSVLRHSVGDHSDGAGWDQDAFDAGVEDALSKPQALAAQLFTLRAEGLLRGPAPDTAIARLSGLLIGVELSAMKPYWLGQTAYVIGTGALAGHYARALTAQGVPAKCMDVSTVTLAGLTATYNAHHPADGAPT